MYNFKNKITTFKAVFALLLFFSSCKDNNPTPTPTVSPTKVYKLLFLDSKYVNGFYLSSTDEANHTTAGKLDYNGTVNATPFWKIGQWNCMNNDMLKATYSFVNNKHTYRVGTMGNMVAVNAADGTITLENNASTEYGLNGIASNPRKALEPWPALLLEQAISQTRIMKVSDKTEVRMVASYKVTKLTDKMPIGTTNPSLHAASFLWYITIQNRTVGSPEFGKYVWFGLVLHDNRYDYAPAFAAVDGGKENNTGAFIYIPDMKPIMSSFGKAQVGKQFNLDVDIMPYIKTALTTAQSRNFLTKTTLNDLYIGATNIGWEVFGTYDVTVEINNFNIKYNEN